MVAGEGWEWSRGQVPIFGQIKFEVSKSTGIRISETVLGQISNTPPDPR